MDSLIVRIVLFLFVGLVAGWLAGLLTKGKGFGLVGNMIVGCLGAVIGGAVAPLLGIAATGLLGQMILATLGAVFLLFLLSRIRPTHGGK